jgi:hypothetical protein
MAEGQRVTLSLQRCPDRRATAVLGPGGLLRRPGLLAGEALLFHAAGSARDKLRGQAAVGEDRVILR